MHPTHRRAAAWLALGLLLAGCGQAAVEPYNEGVAAQEGGKNELAIEKYTRAIELDPEMANAYNNRAVAYFATGQYGKAIADLTETIRLRTAGLDKSDKKQVAELADAYNNRGIAYRHEGQFDKAVADHDEAIRLEPDDGKAFFHRAAAYLGLGQPEEAQADFRSAAELGYSPGKSGP